MLTPRPTMLRTELSTANGLLSLYQYILTTGSTSCLSYLFVSRVVGFTVLKIVFKLPYMHAGNPACNACGPYKLPTLRHTVACIHVLVLDFSNQLYIISAISIISLRYNPLHNPLYNLYNLYNLCSFSKFLDFLYNLCTALAAGTRGYSTPPGGWNGGGGGGGFGAGAPQGNNWSSSPQGSPTAKANSGGLQAPFDITSIM